MQRPEGEHQLSFNIPQKVKRNDQPSLSTETGKVKAKSYCHLKPRLPRWLQRQGQTSSLPGLEQYPLWMGDSVPGCNQLVDFSSSLQETNKKVSDTREASLSRTPISKVTSTLSVQSQTPETGHPHCRSFRKHFLSRL